MVRVLLSLLLLALPCALAADEAVSFRRDVAPILLSKCQACHGPKQAEGGYRIDTFAHLMAAGDSDVPGFAPGKLDDSEAYRRITSDDEGERMPAESDPLPAAQIALIQRWIEQGAKFDADDPAAPLASILPARGHPDAPDTYPFPLPIAALEFGRANDREELFVSGYHEVMVWDANHGELLRRIKNQGQRTYALDLSPDGERLAAASGTPGEFGELRLFDAATGELLSVPAIATDVVLDAAFSPDGKRIAIGTADNRLLVLDAEDAKEPLEITSHSDWVNAVAWSADGKQLAGGSRDKTAKIFDARSGEIIVTYNGHDVSVTGVAFHPDGKQVYSCDASGKLDLWKTRDGKKVQQAGKLRGDALALDDNRDHFVIAGADKSVRLFEMASKKQIREFAGHQDAVLSAVISPDGKRIASGTYAGVVKVWDAASGKEITTFLAAPGYLPARE